MISYYKARRKSDGLFKLKGLYKGFTKKGYTWNSRVWAQNSIRTHVQMNGGNLSDYEIVEYNLRKVAVHDV